MTQHKVWPYYAEDEIQAVTDVLNSGKVNYWTGSVARQFEQAYASYVGVKHAIAVANGTVALDLAWIALGVGQGDEVIVTSRTIFNNIQMTLTRQSSYFRHITWPTRQMHTKNRFGTRSN